MRFCKEVTCIRNALTYSFEKSSGKILHQCAPYRQLAKREDIFQTPTFRVPLLLVIPPIVVYATKTGESTSFNNYSSSAQQASCCSKWWSCSMSDHPLTRFSLNWRTNLQAFLTDMTSLQNRLSKIVIFQPDSFQFYLICPTLNNSQTVHNNKRKGSIKVLDWVESRWILRDAQFKVKTI